VILLESSRKNGSGVEPRDHGLCSADSHKH
jgi:hypothetical protein